MTARRNSRKEAVVQAAMSLVAGRGADGTSVRMITARAGVTEAALYRHFLSKDDLILSIYRRIVDEMAAAKERIAAQAGPLADKLLEWIRVSYEHFDRSPEAFTFVLLTTHNFADEHREITGRQGRIFTGMISQATAAGELEPMDPELAMGHFSGVLLSVPQLINAGTLRGPASRYLDEVHRAVCRIFELPRRG